MSARIARMKTAFGVHVAQMIVNADDVLDYQEMELLGQTYPQPLLMSLGFVDDKGRFTEAYDDARDDALKELSKTISVAEKLELVTVFYKACMADGELDPREWTVLLEAASLLGVSRDQLQRHLDTLTLGRGAAVPPRRRD